MSQNLLLWIAFKEGDDSAFSQIYEEYVDLLYRYGTKFTRDRGIVKDCIHDLFLKLYQNRRKLPEIENLLLFLLGSLKNVVVNKLKAEAKYISLSSADPDFYADFYLQRREEEDASDLEERFLEVLNHLSAKQKEAIYLRYQMDMDYNEIAILLDINPQSARNLVHRAIKKIRGRLSLAIFLSFFLS